MKSRVWIAGIFLASLVAPRCFAPPPLVSGDVPVAGKGRFEWYLGGLYKKGPTGGISRLLPANELVYGFSDRQEFSLEFTGLSEAGNYGLGDAVIGTKYLFVAETDARPGLAGSFEIKLPTGDKARGLGSGEFDYDLRLRTQKTWGRFTLLGNVGYTQVTAPTYGGVHQATSNVWLLSFVQEYRATDRTALLAEIYFESRGAPGEPNSLAVNLGFRHKLGDDLEINAALGRSARGGQRGGPALRLYVGLKWEFGAPWGVHR